jgi:hypothetical protein
VTCNCVASLGPDHGPRRVRSPGADGGVQARKADGRGRRLPDADDRRARTAVPQRGRRTGAEGVAPARTAADGGGSHVVRQALYCHKRIKAQLKMASKQEIGNSFYCSYHLFKKVCWRTNIAQLPMLINQNHLRFLLCPCGTPKVDREKPRSFISELRKIPTRPDCTYEHIQINVTSSFSIPFSSKLYVHTYRSEGDYC